MTDLEWNKYVEKLGRKIRVPEWGMFYKPRKIVASHCPELPKSSITVETEPGVKHVVKYETREFKYKGKTYKRDFVKSYKESYYEKKN